MAVAARIRRRARSSLLQRSWRTGARRHARCPRAALLDHLEAALTWCGKHGNSYVNGFLECFDAPPWPGNQGLGRGGLPRDRRPTQTCRSRTCGTPGIRNCCSSIASSCRSDFVSAFRSTSSSTSSWSVAAVRGCAHPRIEDLWAPVIDLFRQPQEVVGVLRSRQLRKRPEPRPPSTPCCTRVSPIPLVTVLLVDGFSPSRAVSLPHAHFTRSRSLPAGFSDSHIISCLKARQL